MTPRNWVGVGLALVVFALFHLYVSSHEPTWAAAACFGGGLVFAGLLIDADDVLAALRIIRKQGE